MYKLSNNFNYIFFFFFCIFHDTTEHKKKKNYHFFPWYFGTKHNLGNISFLSSSTTAITKISKHQTYNRFPNMIIHMQNEI